MKARGPRVLRLCSLIVLAFAGVFVFGTASAWAQENPCEWTIAKSADPSELTLEIGASATVAYTVTVDCTGVESNPAHSPDTVEVDDSFAGDLGFVHKDQVPEEFGYERTIGPFLECGPQSVENHAVLEFIGAGNLALARAEATVNVDVLCAEVVTPPPPPPPGGGGGGAGGAGGGGAGGVSSGGGALGGEAAVGAVAQGELPFTGLPAWILVVAGFSLVGGGLALVRMARTNS
jgi:uncharacterized membrane protein YgcG